MSQPSLTEIQRWIKDHVHDAVPSGLPENLVQLNLQRGEPGKDRLSVYYGGYIARTQEAIREAYEALCHIIGDSQVEKLTEAYAAKYPSRDYNLSLFGRSLPDFLNDYPLSKELPFLPDLAKLEWAVSEAFHSYHEPAVDPKRFASIAPEDWEIVRFKFQPSLGLIQSSWPVLDIWNAKNTPKEEININLIDRPQRVLIYREQYHVHAELISDLEYGILGGLLAGHALGQICDDLASQIGDEPLPLTEWFSRWMSHGLIVDFRISR